MTIFDRLDRHWPWAQVQPFTGTFAGAAGVRQAVSMLRVSGPVLRHAAADYKATGMPLPDGSWLIQITPDGAIAQWPASALNAALRDVAEAIAARPAAAAGAGHIVLPDGNGGDAVGMDDRRGMALAMDRVNANLTGVDGAGGTFLSASPGHAYLNIGTNGMSYGGSMLSQLIFSPSNIHSGGVVVTRVELPSVVPVPPCPSAEADLRPSYLAVMHASGSIALLARLAQARGEACL